MNSDNTINSVTEGVDYKVMDVGSYPGVVEDLLNEDENHDGITILRPDYKDVVIRCGKLSFGKENEDGTLDCSFDYDILNSVRFKPEELQNDTTFNNLVGDIIIQILRDTLEEGSNGEIIREDTVIIPDAE